ncbi:hypothetical protein DFH06DRAFT_1175697 [Mycena polygramma]|nr:hypothetical protein DFH06DRAFT_1175697 [Mycena polygramma]
MVTSLAAGDSPCAPSAGGPCQNRMAAGTVCKGHSPTQSPSFLMATRACSNLHACSRPTLLVLVNAQETEKSQSGAKLRVAVHPHQVHNRTLVVSEGRRRDLPTSRPCVDVPWSSSPLLRAFVVRCKGGRPELGAIGFVLFSGLPAPLDSSSHEEHYLLFCGAAPDYRVRLRPRFGFDGSEHWRHSSLPHAGVLAMWRNRQHCCARRAPLQRRISRLSSAGVEVAVAVTLDIQDIERFYILDTTVRDPSSVRESIAKQIK